MHKRCAFVSVPVRPLDAIRKGAPGRNEHESAERTYRCFLRAQHVFASSFWDVPLAWPQTRLGFGPTAHPERRGRGRRRTQRRAPDAPGPADRQRGGRPHCAARRPHRPRGTPRSHIRKPISSAFCWLQSAPPAFANVYGPALCGVTNPATTSPHDSRAAAAATEAGATRVAPAAPCLLILLVA